MYAAVESSQRIQDLVKQHELKDAAIKEEKDLSKMQRAQVCGLCAVVLLLELIQIIQNTMFQSRWLDLAT